MACILIVEDDVALADALASALTSRGHAVHVAHTPAESRRLLARLERVDVVISDDDLGPDRTRGVDLLADVLEGDDPPRCVLFTGLPPNHTPDGVIVFDKSDWVALIHALETL